MNDTKIIPCGKNIAAVELRKKSLRDQQIIFFISMHYCIIIRLKTTQVVVLQEEVS